jgi:hypothetical protein
VIVSPGANWTGGTGLIEGQPKPSGDEKPASGGAPPLFSTRQLVHSKRTSAGFSAGEGC